MTCQLLRQRALDLLYAALVPHAVQQYSPWVARSTYSLRCNNLQRLSAGHFSKSVPVGCATDSIPAKEDDTGRQQSVSTCDALQAASGLQLALSKAASARAPTPFPWLSKDAVPVHFTPPSSSRGRCISHVRDKSGTAPNVFARVAPSAPGNPDTGQSSQGPERVGVTGTGTGTPGSSPVDSSPANPVVTHHSAQGLDAPMHPSELPPPSQLRDSPQPALTPEATAATALQGGSPTTCASSSRAGAAVGVSRAGRQDPEEMEDALLEELRACADADDLLALLAEVVPDPPRGGDGGYGGVVRVPPSGLSDTAVREALLRLSLLPRPPLQHLPQRQRRQRAANALDADASKGIHVDASVSAAARTAPPRPPPGPQAAPRRLGGSVPGSGDVTCALVSEDRGRWRAFVAGLFRQLEPSYDTLDPRVLVTLLESCSRLTWLLGRCPSLPLVAATATAGAPDHGPSTARAATAASIGGRGYNPLAAAAAGFSGPGGQHLHPAVPLVQAVLGGDRGDALLAADEAEAAGRGADSVAVAADTSSPQSPQPPRPPQQASSLAARVLSSLGGLGLRDSPHLLSDLLPPLMARRRVLAPADLAAILIAAAELRPAVHSYVPWPDVCSRLAAPGALQQLSSGELVRLARALGDLREDLGLDPIRAPEPDLDLKGENTEAVWGSETGLGERRASARPPGRPGLPTSGGAGSDVAESAMSADAVSYDSIGRTRGRGLGAVAWGAGVGSLQPAAIGVARGEADAEDRLQVALGREAAARARSGAFSGGEVAQLTVAALRTVGLRDPAVLQALSDAARLQLSRMRLDEVSQLLCAHARLGVSDAALVDAVGYTVAADPMSHNVRSLAVTMWAVACLGWPCPDLFSARTVEALLRGMAPPITPAPTPAIQARGLQTDGGGAELFEGPPRPAWQSPSPSLSSSPRQRRRPEQAQPPQLHLHLHPQHAQQQLQLRPFEVANVAWAFARQGVLHPELMRAALRRLAAWDDPGRRKRVPASCLIKVLWASSALGYNDTGANIGRGEGEGGEAAAHRRLDPKHAGGGIDGGGGAGGGGAAGGPGGTGADYYLAHRVAEAVAAEGPAQLLTPAELVQAAEALVPYCAPGGILYDTYGKDVWQRLLEAARQHMERLRPDACVSLLSSLAHLAPPGTPYDSGLLRRAQLRLAPWVMVGHLTAAQLLVLLRVLMAADARAAPLLPVLEHQLLRMRLERALPPRVEATVKWKRTVIGSWEPVGQDEEEVVQQQNQLRGDQAVAALLALGTLQRHGGLLELFRLSSEHLGPALELLPSADAATLVRVLGTACTRTGQQHHQGVDHVDHDYYDDYDDRIDERRGHGKQVYGPRLPLGRQAPYGTAPSDRGADGTAAVAVAVLSSGTGALGLGRERFLEEVWRALSGPGRLEQLTPNQLVDAAWGLAACGYNNLEAYELLAARLVSRVKQLPAWSLARLAAAFRGAPGPRNEQGASHSNDLNRKGTDRQGVHGDSPGAATAGGGGGLARYPLLAERIAKYGTRDLARPACTVKPDAVATLTEIFAEAGPQYGGLFLAAAHRARAWLAAVAAARVGPGGGGGGGRVSPAAAAELRSAVARVRAACERAGYDVSEVLGEEKEEADGARGSKGQRGPRGRRGGDRRAQGRGGSARGGTTLGPVHV